MEIDDFIKGLVAVFGLALSFTILISVIAFYG